MVNVTNTTYIYDYTINTLLPSLKQRLIDMIQAPVVHRDMIWIITPLFITLLLMEFYFGRYSKEEMGWDTAVGNSLVLIFVCLDLLRYMYGETSFFGTIGTIRTIPISNLPVKTVVALVIGIYGFILLFFDFFHWLPKKFAFVVSSTLPINLIAYISVVVVYADLPVDYLTLVSSLVLLVGLFIIFSIIHFIEPKKREEKEIYYPPEPEYEEGQFPGEYPPDRELPNPPEKYRMA